MADPARSKSFANSKNNSASNLRIKKTNKSSTSRQAAIPRFVANRMARRIAFTTGLPTISGMGVFIGSYVVVSKGIADIPPTLTLIGSAVCFLTGLAGLSYGILSSSWEDLPGSLLGLENIKPNIKRMRSAFTSPNDQKDLSK